MGLGRYAFYEKRYDNGVERADFPLSCDTARSAQILITGTNFGCGSSWEHAVWALHDLGVRAILATRFGEIFYSNCFKSGLLPVALPDEDLARLRVSAKEGDCLSIDLELCEVSSPDVSAVSFQIEHWRRDVLLKGWDEVLTLINTQAKATSAFEDLHRSAAPWLFATD